tara:strand:+ start:1891 stop:2286 length:396 start_codon:yes stop_codon:yes gene_type:complete
MLAISYYCNTKTIVRHVNISPQMPLAIAVDEKGAISVDHALSMEDIDPIQHVADTLDELLAQASKHGITMAKFDTARGALYLNISQSTPIWFSSRPDNDLDTTRLHYCGKGYNVYANKTRVIDTIESALAS